MEFKIAFQSVEDSQTFAEMFVDPFLLDRSSTGELHSLKRTVRWGGGLRKVELLPKAVMNDFGVSFDQSWTSLRQLLCSRTAACFSETRLDLLGHSSRELEFVFGFGSREPVEVEVDACFP